MKIPFTIINIEKNSVEDIQNIIETPSLYTSKHYSEACKVLLKKMFPNKEMLLTKSCTGALEIIAASLDLNTNDEIILPSYTYVGVANAFAKTHCKLKFADSEKETLNIEYESIKLLISKNTKAIIIMHYGGIPCQIDKIKQLCIDKNILLIEDNAQGIGVRYQNDFLGNFGNLSTISFDTHKNVSCGEGGLLIYEKKFEKRILETYYNGTDRAKLNNKEKKFYEWVSLGSNYTLSEFNAAILYKSLKNIDKINKKRMEIWNLLFQNLSEIDELVQFLPHYMLEKKHNAHIFPLRFKSISERLEMQEYLISKNIACATHYYPLNLSTKGKQYLGKRKNKLNVEAQSQMLLRLPIYNGLTVEAIHYIKSTIKEYYHE